jgi:hypothetical protein
LILEKDLEGWLSNDFFKKHISQYKKRPIIWHISSPEVYFEVLLYYHKLNWDKIEKMDKGILKIPNLVHMTNAEIVQLGKMRILGVGGNYSPTYFGFKKARLPKAENGIMWKVRLRSA